MSLDETVDLDNQLTPRCYRGDVEGLKAWFQDRLQLLAVRRVRALVLPTRGCKPGWPMTNQRL